MPLHAQLICLGGNLFLVLLFVVAGLGGFADGDVPLGIGMSALAGVAGYSMHVVLKYRRHLDEELARQHEVSSAKPQQSETAKNSAES